MPVREPFKPISIDKKLGEIYFNEKCLLNGFEPAPKTNPFSYEAAEAVLKKYQDPKKAIKIKLLGLADMLRFDKGSKLGKKVPYSKVMYSEVKLHKVFNQSKKILVLGVQGSDKLNQYLVIGFERPIKASHLNDQLSYADLAPKNNLKNKIQSSDVPSARDPSPVYANLATPPHSPETSHQMPRDSVIRQSERTQEITEIQGTGLPRTRYDMSEISVNLNSTKMSEKSIQSPTPSISQKRMTPQSITYTATSGAPNHSPTEAINYSAYQQQESIPLCSKCCLKYENLVSTATSPLVLRKTGSVGGLTSVTDSISSSSSPKSQSKTLNTVSRSNTLSFSRRSINKLHNKRSNSMTSTSSRHTVTTDASSHYVLDEERELYGHQPRAFVPLNGGEEKPNPINTETVVIRDFSPIYMTNSRNRTQNGSRQTRHRKRKSKHEHRARSMVATNNVPVQEYSPIRRSSTVQDYASIQQKTVTTTAAGNRNDDDKPLFILASGRFRPFSEFSHEHDSEQHGICSICGEEGVGDPRQVEIIRTDTGKGPVISDEGCVYMYSATRPVEYTNGNGTRQRSSRSSRHGHRSVSSSRSSRERHAQPSTPPIYRSAVPVQEEQVNLIHVKRKGSVPYSNGRTKSQHTSHESSISSKTRSESRVLVGTIPVYQSTSPTDPRIVEMVIPIEMSKQHNKNRRRSRSSSRHSSMSGGVNITRPVRSATYQEIPLSSERYVTYDAGSRESSGKKKIYRIESSDSDSSSDSDISDPRCGGDIKVRPLRY
ncbi:hypothetical protein ACTXT7_009797 [Hymenolepis weldensis]